MRPIVGLVSSYDEGAMLRPCLESLADCCQRILVLDGPIGGLPVVPVDTSDVPPQAIVRRSRAPWDSDAAKRTELIRWAQKWIPGPAWAVVLDGDEILWAARYLPEYLARCEDDPDGAMKLKLVEAGDDVVVYETGARVLPLERIDRYVLSSYQIKLRGSETVVSLPLAPASRPPAYHEPHIVHRAYLRTGARKAVRQSVDEARRLRALGLDVPDPMLVVR